MGIENSAARTSKKVPCLVLNVRASQGKPLPSQRVGSITANLSEELSGYIPNNGNNWWP